MPVMQLTLDEPAWPDLDLSKVIHFTDPIKVAALAGGMQSGKPSVALRFDLPDGRILIAETSLELFYSIARGIAARHMPELNERPR